MYLVQQERCYSFLPSCCALQVFFLITSPWKVVKVGRAVTSLKGVKLQKQININSLSPSGQVWHQIWSRFEYKVVHPTSLTKSIPRSPEISLSPRTKKRREKEERKGNGNKGEKKKWVTVFKFGQNCFRNLGDNFLQIKTSSLFISFFSFFLFPSFYWYFLFCKYSLHFNSLYPFHVLLLYI